MNIQLEVTRRERSSSWAPFTLWEAMLRSNHKHSIWMSNHVVLTDCIYIINKARNVRIILCDFISPDLVTSLFTPGFTITNHHQQKKNLSPLCNLHILPTIKAAMRRTYRRVSEMLFKLQIPVLLHMVQCHDWLLAGHLEEQTCHHSIGELMT